MKKFKPGILLTSIITILAFMSVLYISACNNKAPGLSPDSCENIVCQNQGYCSFGACVCPTSGYEGSRCETKWNAKFVGYWNVNEFVTGSDYFDSIGHERLYQIRVDSGATPTSIFISNLRGTGTNNNVPAIIDSTTTKFSISTYTPVSNGNFTITGGYCSYLIKHPQYVNANRDTAYGVYYINYLNSQYLKEHDTISFYMTK